MFISKLLLYTQNTTTVVLSVCVRTLPACGGKSAKKQTKNDHFFLASNENVGAQHQLG